jgi:hypothetical protein
MRSGSEVEKERHNLSRVIAGHTADRGHFLPRRILPRTSTHPMVAISPDGADVAEVADLATRGWFKLLANGLLILMTPLRWLLSGLLSLVIAPLRLLRRMRSLRAPLGLLRFLRSPLRLLLRLLSRCRGGGGGSNAPQTERRRGVSPLHDLLEDMPDFFTAEVLARLGPVDCTMLAQVGHQWLVAVLAANLPRAGKGGAVRLKLKEFVGSVARLAWAKANGCPWDWKTSALIARNGGHLAVLQWAWQNGCP